MTFSEIVQSKARGNLGPWSSYVIHIKFILARNSVGSLFVSIWVVVYIDCGFKAFLFSFRDIVFYGEMVYIGRGVRRWDGLLGSDFAWSTLHGGPGVGSGEFQR